MTQLAPGRYMFSFGLQNYLSKTSSYASTLMKPLRNCE
jgi:hypothetical protein